MRYTFAFVIALGGLLGGLEGTAQEFSEEMLAQSVLAPMPSSDSCMFVFVPRVHPKTDVIDCENKSVAGVVRALAGYYGLDSIAFVKPIDTTGFLLWGAFRCAADRPFAMFDHLSHFCRSYAMWPQHKTLYVWTKRNAPEQ